MPIEAAAMRRVKAPSSRSARALRLGVRQLGINRLRSHDELAAEIEPAVPHLGLREEAVAFDLAAPAEVAHLQAACDECVGDEAAMATPPRCLGAHQAWPLSRQRASERGSPVGRLHPDAIAAKRRHLDTCEPLVARAARPSPGLCRLPLSFDSGLGRR